MPQWNTGLLTEETYLKMRMVCVMQGMKIKDFIQQAVDEKIERSGLEIPTLTTKDQIKILKVENEEKE